MSDDHPKPAVPDEPILDTTRQGSPRVFGGVRGASPAAQDLSVGDELIFQVVLEPGLRASEAFLSDRVIAPGVVAGRRDQWTSVALLFGLLSARPIFTGPEERDAGLAPSTPVSERADRERFLELRFPSTASADGIRRALEETPEVRAAVLLPTAAPPNMGLAERVSDPLVGTDAVVQANPQGIQSQWYLHRTSAVTALERAQGSGVVLADVDWGCRVTHADFATGVLHTYNAWDGSADVAAGSEAAHGTAVVGLAAARANGTGMSGYAPEAEIWVLQGNAGNGVQKFSDPWVEALAHVRQRSAGTRRKVIIFEVQTGRGGNYEQVPAVNRAIKEAIAAGCVVCVAAGNGNRAADRDDSGRLFPATGSILVSATAYHEAENRRAPFSNFGNTVVICAPGDLEHDVTCGQSSDQAYRNDFGGTSGATPKVAGTVALMLSVNPALSHAEVRQILIDTGTAVHTEAEKPIGRFLNTEAALGEAERRAGQ